jgi:hypothetical protein
VIRQTTALLTVALFGWFAITASAEVNEESLSYGCGGGFTGAWGGVLVQRDGEIYRLSRPGRGGPVEQTFIRIDRGAARDVFAEVERIKFTSIHYRKPFNITCEVTLRQGASSHAVAWGPNDPNAPSQVVALASRIQQIANVKPVEPK